MQSEINFVTTAQASENVSHQPSPFKRSNWQATVNNTGISFSQVTVTKPSAFNAFSSDNITKQNIVVVFIRNKAAQNR